MTRFTFTIDDVLRAKTLHIGRIYKKFIKHEIDLTTLDFSTTDYATIFGFETLEDYHRFLYFDYVLEIFGSAPSVNVMVDKLLNNWITTANDDYEEDEDGFVDITLANAFESDTSIGCTMNYLSKIAPRIRKYYFPKDSSTMWNDADVIITATPEVLNSKPDGKIAVKIEMDYNKECPSDYTYKSLNDFFKDKETIEKIRKINKED